MDEKVPDGIVRHLGKTYFIKDGRAQMVTNELKLSEGIVAQPDGKVTLKDGKKVDLANDQMVTLTGEVKFVSPSITTPDESKSEY